MAKYRGKDQTEKKQGDKKLGSRMVRHMKEALQGWDVKVMSYVMLVVGGIALIASTVAWFTYFRYNYVKNAGIQTADCDSLKVAIWSGGSDIEVLEADEHNPESIVIQMNMPFYSYVESYTVEEPATIYDPDVQASTEQTPRDAVHVEDTCHATEEMMSADEAPEARDAVNVDSGRHEVDEAATDSANDAFRDAVNVDSGRHAVDEAETAGYDQSKRDAVNVDAGQHEVEVSGSDDADQRRDAVNVSQMEDGVVGSGGSDSETEMLGEESGEPDEQTDMENPLVMPEELLEYSFACVNPIGIDIMTVVPPEFEIQVIEIEDVGNEDRAGDVSIPLAVFGVTEASQQDSSPASQENVVEEDSADHIAVDRDERELELEAEEMSEAWPEDEKSDVSERVLESVGSDLQEDERAAPENDEGVDEGAVHGSSSEQEEAYMEAGGGDRRYDPQSPTSSRVTRSYKTTEVSKSKLAPGVYGELVLYLTPLNVQINRFRITPTILLTYADGYKDVINKENEEKWTVDLVNSKGETDGETEKAGNHKVEVELSGSDVTVDNLRKLVQGHILFFEKKVPLLDEDGEPITDKNGNELYEYQDPLIKMADGTYALRSKEGELVFNETEHIGKEKKVTIYWYWPYEYADIPTELKQEIENETYQNQYYPYFFVASNNSSRDGLSQLYDYADTRIGTYVKSMQMHLKVDGYHHEETSTP